MADINKTYEELANLKEQIDEAAVNLKKVSRNCITGVIIRSIVSLCASEVIGKLSEAFLPKSLKGPAKIAAAFGAFFIPDIIGAKAEDLTIKIMEEE